MAPLNNTDLGLLKKRTIRLFQLLLGSQWKTKNKEVLVIKRRALFEIFRIVFMWHRGNSIHANTSPASQHCTFYTVCLALTWFTQQQIVQPSSPWIRSFLTLKFIPEQGVSGCKKWCEQEIERNIKIRFVWMHEEKKNWIHFLCFFFSLKSGHTYSDTPV